MEQCSCYTIKYKKQLIEQYIRRYRQASKQTGSKLSLGGEFVLIFRLFFGMFFIIEFFLNKPVVIESFFKSFYNKTKLCQAGIFIHSVKLSCLPTLFQASAGLREVQHQPCQAEECLDGAHRHYVLLAPYSWCYTSRVFLRSFSVSPRTSHQLCLHNLT